MVSGHGENWSAKTVKEGPCCAVLLGTRAHGEVAADGDEVRGFAIQLLHQRFHHGRVDEVEMQVGDVSYATHESCHLSRGRQQQGQC